MQGNYILRRELVALLGYCCTPVLEEPKFGISMSVSGQHCRNWFATIQVHFSCKMDLIVMCIVRLTLDYLGQGCR